VAGLLDPLRDVGLRALVGGVHGDHVADLALPESDLLCYLIENIIEVAARELNTRTVPRSLEHSWRRLSPRQRVRPCPTLLLAIASR
jgi:hypothetical protein